MYYTQSNKEPNGCLQTIMITRMILMILAIPLAFIGCGIIAVLLFFWSLTISPFLALGEIALAGGLFYLAGKWEAHRIARDKPPMDDY